MARMPNITVHINLENLDTINDEVLIWELCRRHRKHTANAPHKIKFFTGHKVISLPIGPDYYADLILSEEAYLTLMGEAGDE